MDRTGPAPIERQLKIYGLDGMNPGLFLLLALLWLGLFAILVCGLFGLIWDVLWHELPNRTDSNGVWDWRFRLVQLTALTTVLGGVIALPITLNKVRLTMEQTATAKAALFNSKITEAAADLHATRQVSKKVGKNKWETVWEDDIVRRNAAIDRLEGLVREEPAEAGRVSRLLSVYVRELSKEYPAQKTPDTDDIKKLKDWAKALKIARSDIENAVQMLGRLADINGVYSQNLEIDLRRANLQAMDLKRLSYPSANFDHAQMQGALLSHSSLENASFCHADMKNAVLYKISASFAFFTGTIMQSAVLDFSTFTKADFTGAKLNRAKLQGCDLTQAHLTGAIMKSTSFAAADIRMVHLRGIVICEDADLTMANLQGSAVKGSDFGQLQHIADHLDTVFGDDTTRLPNGVSKLNHWPQEELSFGDFEVQWRKWTMTIDIDIPE
ncbi:uncharacterized protein YjbI with pentapeptide repeats [Pelagimonas varians]|uniref:Secreted effector protein pipB2 n=2 Tax=Pelagimonas varians TaxID=696760 RepID=A0A238KD54_9RHOB|nr:uncharacterized protein YjbI with pentapeptide repeats [Pelagimonas varians]SMX40760.1 Secreted effector protein pipB2 [Pelagimonas varians]